MEVSTDDQKNLCASVRGSEQLHDVVEENILGGSFTKLALRGRESRLGRRGRHQRVALFSAIALSGLVWVPVLVRPDVHGVVRAPQLTGGTNMCRTGCAGGLANMHEHKRTKHPLHQRG